MNTRPQATLLAFASLTLLVPLASAQPSRPQAAQEFGKKRASIQPQSDGLLVAEAEEFVVNDSKGWSAKDFGENYYAATFANSFLSRKAFLGAPENGPRTTASVTLAITNAGRYHVLARYEAAYRFETRFTVRIEQGGKPVFERNYGARTNPKIWAFSEKVKPEVGWSWGASENIVWEGHDAFAHLQPGNATLTLIADPQPEPAARRNVDLVMLTTDSVQVAERIEKERYLPLDGMLTQAGDVWLRVKNSGPKPLTFKGGRGQSGGNWQEHSPYWVHMRTWQSPTLTIPVGNTSEWVDVGGTMDSLAHGQWSWHGDGPFEAEFGLKSPSGTIERIGLFQGTGDLHLAADCDTRYSRRLRKQEDVLPELMNQLRPVAKGGRAPNRTPVFANTFQPIPGASLHNAALEEFTNLLGIVEPQPNNPKGKGYVDVRSIPTEKLREHCLQKLGTPPENIAVASLGDEISLQIPTTSEDKAAFGDWLKSRGANPETVGLFDPNPSTRTSNPARYYWSVRYSNWFGINKIRERTSILANALPNAGIGANYSPHYPQEHLYLGETHKWAQIFRDGGMTMPWSEDYIWQVPVLSPQINHLSLDLFRAGIRHQPKARIHFYVMPHMPNNTPAMWRRLFYGALAHGAKVLNLFEFRTVHAAYTENHVDEFPMYEAVAKGLRELGTFEDAVQDGRVQFGRTGLWFGETGDIWGDSKGSFAAAKRALYLAIRHQQAPLDLLIEPDASSATLDSYQAIYLTDRHVDSATSARLAEWVEKGGSLFATAGAGMFDEFDRPNKTLRTLLGADETALDVPEDRKIVWIKQDLPFSEPLTTAGTLPVLSARSRFTPAKEASVELTFKDGTPAVVHRVAGKGSATYCGFLPGLSYFHSAIPKRPVDRGATDDAFIHFLPSDFHQGAQDLISKPLAKISKPVYCNAPLVESTLIESKSATLVPLINWTRTPVASLEVSIETPRKNARAATGSNVSTKREGSRLVCRLPLEVADALILTD
jgi:hypothetical protein